MLSVLNALSHGYVAVPVIEALSERGCLTPDPDGKIPLLAPAAEIPGANPGYMACARHMTACLGWLIEDPNTGPHLSPSVDPASLPHGFTALYGIPFDRILDRPEAVVLETYTACFEALAAAPQHAALFEGAIYTPLLIAMRHQLDQCGEPLPADLDPHLRELLLKHLTAKGWFHQGRPTETGAKLIERAYVMAIAASYRPMLAGMDDLLFGDPRRVFFQNPDGSEAHIDRRMNVIASGFQHERYFRDAEQLILGLFDEMSLDEQPRYLADMGCGNGAFLKQIYTAVRAKTRRGAHLESHPLTLIGVDYNQAALDETGRTLSAAGLPHLTLRGDINDPDRLVRDLREMDVDPDRVLHIRSFLDHNFRHTPPAVLDPDTAHIRPAGVYLSGDGEPVTPRELATSWKAYLERWAGVLNGHGLVLLESHCLSPQQTRRWMDRAENFYFDTIHAFSAQYLQDAESFLMLAAGAGLFPRRQPRRYPKTLPFCRITLSHLEKRPYHVRHARGEDLPVLEALEAACWPQPLRTPAAQLAQRLERYPAGQLVLEWSQPKRVVGVIYSQRIGAESDLQGRSMDDIQDLHHADGPLVQLIAVNVDPTMQQHRAGDQLLEFMLQRCSLMSGVTGVVGVTRCRDFDAARHGDMAAYARMRNHRDMPLDPTLRFHVSHGASVGEVVPGFRPRDEKNQTHGVLIRYDIHNRHRVRAVARPQSDAKQRELAIFLEKTIRLCLDLEPAAPFDKDAPLMEMGLDSADLLELTEQITSAYGLDLEAAFFFKHNTPAKIAAELDRRLHRLNPQPADDEDVSVASVDAPLPTTACTALPPGAVAVIGQAFTLADGLERPDQLWDLLIEGRDALSGLPAGRFAWPDHMDPAGAHRGIEAGGFIRDVACFDAAFFRITPREALSMDPQQRLMLEMTQRVCEDAAVLPGALAETKTGVYIGASGSDYARLLDQSGLPADAHFGTGVSMAVLANRISYFYNLNGPSRLVDTACSSSLVALHDAVRDLREGQVKAALVGAVNLICHPAETCVYYKAGMLSPDGRCKTFAADADGYVRGEGAVMLLLKPLADAVAAADPIHAVIRGGAVNHGGQSGGLTVPNPTAQTQLLHAAWRDAGVEPHQIQYIEAHGTGTRLGDPIEIQAMVDAFQGAGANRVGVGSVKTNLGHLEAAAGMAGLLKLVLALKHRRIPASLHCETLNPRLPLDGSPLQIIRQPQDWPQTGDHPPLAGLSSFGSGGANAHVIVQAAPAVVPTPDTPGPHLLVLSAKDTAHLKAAAHSLRQWLNTPDGRAAVLADLCYTLQTGRQAGPERLAAVVHDHQELLAVLDRFLNQQTEGLFHHNHQHSSSEIQGRLDGASHGTVETALRDGDWAGVARLWTLGADVDWSRLVTGVQPRRIPVHTTAFVRERFWLDAPVIAPVKTAGIHPLLDRNTSTQSEFKFVKTLAVNDFYLKDHVVQGRVILPGVAHLEMAAVAAGMITERPVNRLEDVIWGRPALLDGDTLDVTVALAVKSDGMGFSISKVENGKRLELSRGRLAHAERTPQRFDLKALRESASVHMAGHQVYQRLQQRGFAYGPSFQLTQDLYAFHDAALIRIDVPEAPALCFDQFVWHPSLMDTALRAAYLMGLGLNDLNDVLRIPFSLGAVHSFGPFPKQAYAYARLTRMQGDDHVVTVSLLDASGVEVLVFEDFISKAFSGLPKTPVHLFQPVWRDQPLPMPTVQADPVLVITDHHQVVPGWNAAMTNLEPCGFDALPQRLQQPLPPTVVIVPNDLPDGLPLDAEDTDFNQALDQTLLTLTRLVAVLRKSQKPTRMLLCVHTTSAVALTRAVGGFAKALPAIAPHVILSILELDSAVVDGGARVAAELAEAARNGAHVRYRAGQRQLLNLEAVAPSGEPSSGLSGKSCVLITGGQGGLGRLFAKHLAGSGVGLILVGRSAPDTRLHDALRDAGARVQYIQADLADSAALTVGLEQARAELGPIRAILHCAGVAGPRFVDQAEPVAFRANLSAKVDGALQLHGLTLHDPVETFVLFSSLAAHLGDFGRGAYAAANGFLDGFAAQRNVAVAKGRGCGHTLSVNWPYWEDGGFGKDFFGDERGEAAYFQRAGLKALSAAQGVQLLEQLCAGDMANVVVAPGAKAPIQAALGVQSVRTQRVVQPVAVSELRHDADLKAAAVRYLIGQVAEVTGLAAQAVQAAEPLETYGIDSMIIMDMNTRLENDFGKLPSTLFFEYGAILDLADYFTDQHGARLRALLHLDTSAPPVTPVVAVPAKPPVAAAQPTLPSKPTQTGGRQVAVIGMSGRYPMAPDLDTFWDNLRRGRDCIEEIPAERWDYRRYFQPQHPKPGQTDSKWGGFIADVDQFDALFFNISPREADYIDPQQRLFAEVAWEACEDAAYTWDRLSNRANLPETNDVGVFVGSMYDDYQFFEKDTATSYWNAFIANRISYFFNFRGPSISMDTACSSSLTAIHAAYESLIHGHCFAALAGGTNLSIHPNKYARLTQLNLLSKEGRCRGFGAGGSGYVPGEGVGAILMKRLEDAERDGDPIYAVFLGGAVNHGGKTNGFTVPNPNAQAELIAKALDNADVRADQLSYVEAHGTGTSLGDPIEVTGLTKAFRRHTPATGFCALATVKSNVGHLEGAAGVVAVTKVILQLKHRLIAPSLHTDELNPRIDFAHSPFTVQRQLGPWPKPEHGRRIAGVSSFGAGGSNAHMILAEYPQPPISDEAVGPMIIPIAAKTPASLSAYARKLLTFVEAQSAEPEAGPLVAKPVIDTRLSELRVLLAEALAVDPAEIEPDQPLAELGVDAVILDRLTEVLVQQYHLDRAALNLQTTLNALMDVLPTEHRATQPTTPRLQLRDLAYTLQVGREPMEERAAFVVNDLGDLAQQLSVFLEKGDTHFSGNVKQHKATLNGFLDDEDMADAVRAWVAKGKLHKLADAWTKGMPLPWADLHDHAAPRKIHAPTYAFDRQSYWVPETVEAAAPTMVTDQRHPLLHHNRSSFKRQRFTAQLPADAFYFTDHQVHGKKILPGVAYLEMALVGGTILAEATVHRLRDILWIRPMVAVDQPLAVEVRFQGDADAAQFEVVDAADGGPFARGRLAQAGGSVPATLDLAALQAGAVMTGEAAYQRFAQRGFQYSGAFRNIQQVWLGHQSALAQIQLPRAAQSPDFRLHPGLLDSALQAALLLADDGDAAWLPYALDDLEVFGELPASGFSRVIQTAATATEKRFDVLLTDAAGRVLVRADGLSLRALADPSGKVRRHYYRHVMRPQPSVVDQRQPALPALLFAPDDVGAFSDEVILVRRGERFAVEATGYRINPARADHYDQLLQALSSQGIAFQDVAHAFSLSDDHEISTLHSAGLFSVFHLARALARHHAAAKHRVLFFHPLDHARADALAAVAGFMRSLGLERPQWDCRTVGLTNPAEWCDVLHEERRNADARAALEIHHDGGRRLIADLEPVAAPTRHTLTPKPDGVYLITGGAGGLGLIFARHLSSLGASVVLCGRSELSADKEATLPERAVYLRADISDRARVEDLHGRIHQRFGRLDGVIHAAGVARNSYVTNKTVEEIDAVLAPKLQGTIHLDEVTQADKLDFFVCFSSISSVLPFVGQSDYSYANRFQDLFMARRADRFRQGLRHGRSIAVNWPLWREGGMHVDAQSESFLQATMGIHLFETRDGMPALLDAMSLGESALMVIHGDADKLARYRGRDAVARPAATTPTPVGTGNGDLHGLLRRTIAGFLKLDVDRLADDAELADFGVDSISSMQLANLLNGELQLELSPALFLEYGTIQALAEHLQAEHGAHLQAHPEPAEAAVPPVAPLVQPAPAAPTCVEAQPTHGQRALWFLHRLAPQSPAYHVALTAEIRSPLNADHLFDAFALLADRHAALRTSFIDRDGQPLRLVHDQRRPLMERRDVGELELAQVVKSTYETPFDPARDPLMRVHLFRVSASYHVLLLNMHHLVVDAWSVWRLMGEFGVVYAAMNRGEAPDLPRLEHDFEDYQAAIADYPASQTGRRHRDWWLDKLSGQVPALNLPTDHPRPKARQMRGASVPFTLDAKLADALNTFARARNLTPFMVFLTAYQILLHRYSGDDRIWIGSPASGRGDGRFNHVVGYFVNPMVLTADVSDRPIGDTLLSRTRRELLDALARQDMPFPLLVEALNPPRDGGRTPLFCAEMVYQKAEDGLIELLAQHADAELELGGLTLRAFPMDQQEGQFDLTLEVMENRNGFNGALKFDRDLFLPATAARMARHFETLLRALCTTPSLPIDKLPLLGEDERHRMVVAWNQTQQATPTQHVNLHVEAQVAEAPDRIALQFGDTHFSYDRLNRKANQLAHHLRALGVDTEDLVAVCLPRSPEMVVALLAVLKAGAGYIPMDPDYPAERLSYMLEHARPKVLIQTEDGPAAPVDGPHRVRIDLDWPEIAQQPQTNPAVLSPAGATAYVIYTSGSTGKPKGVRISRFALNNFLHAMGATPGLKADDALLAVTTVSFDIAGLELYLPLIKGARLILADARTTADAVALQRLMQTSGATVMQATPATWRMLLASGWRGQPNLTVLSGGEALPANLAEELLPRCGALFNMYGPTETTIWSCVAPVTATEAAASAVVTIGKPIHNTAVYILDGHLNPVPVGVAGDLFIGGHGLAMGYLHRGDLTAERFIPNPFGSGDRLYLTGDQARYRADGAIEFLGRNDFQIKIRGFRIETGEIEAVIKEHPGVSDAVVMRFDGDRLAAYLIHDDHLQMEDLRVHLAARLPHYMIPAALVRLDAFPLTPNNKVDRKALPAPGRSDLGLTRAEREAQNPTEQRLLELWRALLQRDDLGVEDDFFAAGGTSMTATRLIYQIEQHFQVDLPVGRLFAHPTVAALAAAVQQLKSPPNPPPDSEPDDSALLALFEDLQQDRITLDDARLMTGIQP